jgi:hypothetical protein
MPISTSSKPEVSLSIVNAADFLFANAAYVLLISALVLVPCFWQLHIEAGDLASHTYNAWLAQLAVRGEAPGVNVARQWDNVLFDVLESSLGAQIGFLSAEKIVVAVAVLILFWGVFAFLSAATGNAPWLFTPCIAILAYGYVFSMGFINFYFSVGLACFALAILWRGGFSNHVCAVPVAALTLVAHPIGFAWLVAMAVYLLLWRNISSLWRLILPALAIVALIATHRYIVNHTAFRASWRPDPFYLRNGSDQMLFYGHRYTTLLHVTLMWGVVCFIAGLAFHLRRQDSQRRCCQKIFTLQCIPAGLACWFRG